MHEELCIPVLLSLIFKTGDITRCVREGRGTERKSKGRERRREREK